MNKKNINSELNFNDFNSNNIFIKNTINDPNNMSSIDFLAKNHQTGKFAFIDDHMRINKKKKPSNFNAIYSNIAKNKFAEKDIFNNNIHNFNNDNGIISNNKFIKTNSIKYSFNNRNFKKEGEMKSDKSYDNDLNSIKNLDYFLAYVCKFCRFKKSKYIGKFDKIKSVQDKIKSYLDINRLLIKLIEMENILTGIKQACQ